MVIVLARIFCSKNPAPPSLRSQEQQIRCWLAEPIQVACAATIVTVRFRPGPDLRQEHGPAKIRSVPMLWVGGAVLSGVDALAQVLDSQVLKEAAANFSQRSFVRLDQVLNFRVLPALGNSQSADRTTGLSSQLSSDGEACIDAVQTSKAICVLQSESATVPLEHGYIVGSSDATTCVLAFVVTLYSISCLHIDEQTCTPAHLNRSLRGMQDSAGGELFLVGGYDDNHGLSAKILRQVLHFYTTCSAELELKLAFVGRFNTKVQKCYADCASASSKGASHAHSAPRISGAAFCPTRQVLTPAEIRYRGPMLVERQVRCMMKGPYADIYDASRQCLVFEPWPHRLDCRTRRRLQRCCRVPDEVLLHLISTSPHAERPSFASDVRACLQRLVRGSNGWMPLLARSPAASDSHLPPSSTNPVKTGPTGETDTGVTPVRFRWREGTRDGKVGWYEEV